MALLKQMSMYTSSLVFAAFGFALWHRLSEKLDSSPIPYICKNQYSTEILSLDPLVLYINNFVSHEEADSLLSLSNEYNYTYSEDLYPEHKLDRRRRTSSYIIIPSESESEVASCVRSRAESLAGFLPYTSFEDFQIVRYLPNQQHDFHVDWHRDPDSPEPGMICNRLLSFFVFLGDDCIGGETYFPEINAAPKNSDGRKYSRTDKEGDKGLAVKPIKGSAIFWMNLHQNGTGDERVQHAGLRVSQGTKSGMNILGEWCGPDALESAE